MYESECSDGTLRQLHEDERAKRGHASIKIIANDEPEVIDLRRSEPLQKVLGAKFAGQRTVISRRRPNAALRNSLDQWYQDAMEAQRALRNEREFEKAHLLEVDRDPELIDARLWEMRAKAQQAARDRGEL